MTLEIKDEIRKNKGTIYVPKGIEDTLAEFAKKYSNGLEFGMYLKAEMHYENAAAIILPSYAFLPKQEDSGAFFHAVENPPDESVNAIVHRHPTNCCHFSGYDWTDILRQADCNILFTAEQGVCDGVMRFRGLNDDNLILQCDIVLYEPEDDEVIHFSSKEVKAKVKQNSWSKYGNEF